MMLEILNSLSWKSATFSLIVFFIAFSVCGILLVRALVNHNTLKKHHDVAAVVFANIGVLYGVLLGFTVVNVQQRFDKIQEIIQVEASDLIELSRNAEVFPEKAKLEIRAAIINYIEDVLTREWELMKERVIVNEKSAAESAIWQVYYNITPSNDKELAWYTESISKLNQCNSARVTRLLGSRQSLGSEMWTLLILGGCALITFMWFFGLESLAVHIMMTSILTASTVFLLFLIYSLDTVFTGGVIIPPEAFVKALQTLRS